MHHGLGTKVVLNEGERKHGQRKKEQRAEDGEGQFDPLAEGVRDESHKGERGRDREPNGGVCPSIIGTFDHSTNKAAHVAVLVRVATDHRDAQLQGHVTKGHTFASGPRPCRAVACQFAGDHDATCRLFREQVSVHGGQFIRIERSPEPPRHGGSTVLPCDVVRAPRQFGVEFDVRVPRSVNLERGSWFVHISLDDEPPCVLFEAAPKHASLRPATGVVHPQGQAEGVPHIHIDVEHDPLPLKEVRAVRNDRLDNLLDRG